MNIHRKHIYHLVGFSFIFALAVLSAQRQFSTRTAASGISPSPTLDATNPDTVEETVTLPATLSTSSHYYRWVSCGENFVVGRGPEDIPGTMTVGYEHYYKKGAPLIGCDEGGTWVNRGLISFDLTGIRSKAPPLHVSVTDAKLRFKTDRDCSPHYLLIAQADWSKGYDGLVPGDEFSVLPKNCPSCGLLDVAKVLNNWLRGESHGGYEDYGFVIRGTTEEDWLAEGKTHWLDNDSCWTRYSDVSLTVTYKYDKTPVPSAPPAPIILAVPPPARVASGITPSTPLAITSGVIGNINDNNPATTCEVQGVASTSFWFVLDLGSSQKISRVELLQWYETGFGDAGFTLQYSDSPLTGSNVGNTYGASFSASTTPQNTSRTGSATARYWGLMRYGDFSANRVGVANFNVYR